MSATTSLRRTSTWRAGIAKADAAARDVTEALKKLETLSQQQKKGDAVAALPKNGRGRRCGHPQNARNGTDSSAPPVVTAPPAATVEQLQARIEKLEKERDVAELTAMVNAAKNEYCDALLEAMPFPKTLLALLHVIFTKSLYPDSEEGEVDRYLLKQSECTGSPVAGRCPLRAALLASWHAAAGELQLPSIPKLSGKRLSHAECNAAQRLFDELYPMVTPIDGRCPKCGDVGRCRTHQGIFSCDTGGSEIETLEKGTHIIPHAAASFVAQTSLLLSAVDGRIPSSGSETLTEYLASPHNVFNLSSCFERYFDSGAFVFVKIGPPECQFYRVTTTPKAAARVIKFEVDLQMRELFRHMSSTNVGVPLSCIDGLVVDLARPAKVISCDGVEHGVPPVSHRYLDLHARAHSPLLLDAPLVVHKYAALHSPPARVVNSRAKRGHKNSRSRGRDDEAALQEEETVWTWLDALEASLL